MIKSIPEKELKSKLRVGIVSSFERSDVCGLKLYAQRLSNALENLGVAVERIPTDDRSYFYGIRLKNEVKRLNLDIVEIQHEYGLFRNFLFIYGVGIIMYYFLNAGIRTITTLHTLADEKFFSMSFKENPFWANRFKFYRDLKSWFMINNIKTIINRSDAVIVQTKDAYRLLIDWGFKDKVYYIPHGTPELEIHRTSKFEYDLISYGILNRSERFDIVFKIIEGMNLNYLLHVSKCIHPSWLEELKKKRPSGVEFLEGFLHENELFRLISSSRAVIIPPCRHASSPSGVLHDAISLGKPVIAPREGEFKDFEDFLLTYENEDELKRCIKIILDDKNLKRYEQKSEELARKTSYKLIAKERIKIYEEMME